MDKDEALRIALEALIDLGWHNENCPQFPTWAEPKKHPPCTCGYDTTITALRQALSQSDDAAWAKHLKEPMSKKCMHESDTIERECNPHPDAPHGFNRDASHGLGRYVCDCEGWEPEPWDTTDMGIDRGAWDDVPDATKWVDELRGGDETVEEPFGYFQYDIRLDAWVQNKEHKAGIAFYTAPPQREWQGLTDEEREYLWSITPIEDEYRFAFVLAVEAKLKEKNG